MAKFGTYGEGGRPRRLGLLLSAAAFVVVVTGMRAAAGILVPFFLAVFLAILCSAPVSGLQKIGLPRWLAVTLVVLGLLAFGSGIGTLLGTSIIDFTRSLPLYQARLETELLVLLNWLEERGVEVSRDFILAYFEMGKILQVVGTTFTALRDVLTNIVLILITVIFILIEMYSFPAKMQAAFGEAEATSAHGAFLQLAEDVRRYLGIKTLISLATGALVAAWLAILGVDYPLLWGLLAFLLNYVPTIGSWIAAIPAVLFAYLQLGPGTGVAAALGYVVVNTLMGNLIEPRVMGRGVGLSTLVVFLSLIFWGWVLGPVGMLLSVPLTVILKIALGLQKNTRWIAVLLGPERPVREIAPSEAP
ncbi:MAG: AI-2E family transporter [Gemmatimonadota bacterium]|jgi:predicted PurR-regulated permease PerM|nr:MAG: AI-2E family transporter [Gemmatimonadota bacterium]